MGPSLDPESVLSAPEYPVFDLPPGHEPPPGPTPVPPRHGEDPPWSGWDVLGIALLTILAIVVFLFATTLAAQQLLFPRQPAMEVAKIPLVTVAAQGLAYIAVLIFMIALVKRLGRSFGQALRWNWPRNSLVYLLGGVVLAFGLQGLAHFLPMPKELPIDRFFQTTSEAWVLSVFGVTLAPLLEELFFRGFLYPVLVRRLGVFAAVLLTSAGFGLIHAPQLCRAWAPVLVVFLVGLALTITRALTKSVASSLLIHIAYNGTISALIFAASDGFRHLDKLNQ
jgi:membrane protease YdiL (CAAX protease family)